jgi:starch-binding outer membrane protein SusE/F
MNGIMKTFKILIAFVAMAFAFASCEEDPQAVLNSNVKPNQLMELSSESYVLTSDDKATTMETLEWTVPEFGYQASASYTVQIDYAGNGFADAVDVATVNTTKLALNVGAFNDQLLGLGLTPEEAADIEIRVRATISAKVAPVYSNAQTIEVTAYATSFPPIYGMGAALKGWGPWPGNAVEWQSSEYKKYSTIAYFTNNETFRWFGTLSWDQPNYNYPFFTSVDTEFVNANDGDSNLRVAAASGWYRVDVDLGAKTVVAEAVTEPVLYMMGDALNGWGPWPGAAVKMTYVKPGVFVADASFIQDKIFRFFPQADWGPNSYNYEYFTTVDPKFVLNSPDNDKNFKYIAASGTQKITVDLNAKTVTLGTPPDPVLFITGDDFGWGWEDGKYMQLTYKGSNTFELTATLTNGNLFRFFPTKGWDPSYKYGYFTTVDSDLESQGAGTDDNFRYIGTTGSRKITVNMTAKTVTLD